MLPASDLSPALRGLRFAHTVHFHPTIGSTMNEAKALAEAGAREGTLVLAEEQTTGRGRSGRAWLTPPGSALAVSLVLRPNLRAEHAARLTMLAGVVVCEAIEHTAGVRAALKWPNDVLIDRKKTAGVLIESALRGDELEYAVLGIGVNVTAAPPPEAVDYRATCVQAETERAVDRVALLRALLERLEARYSQLQTGETFTDWRARLATLGQWIEFREGAETVVGLAEDATVDGALVLRLETGARRQLHAGDVRGVRAADTAH